MSKTENTVVEPKTVEFKRTYEGFDSNLKLVSKEVPVKYTEVLDQNAALEVLNRTNGFVAAANVLLRKEALDKAKVEAGVSGGFNRQVVMDFIKPWRELPQFSSMVKAEDKRKATADEWNAQTEAILEQVRQIPSIMAQLKIQSESANASEE
jgi:hypothetical protein